MLFKACQRIVWLRTAFHVIAIAGWGSYSVYLAFSSNGAYCEQQQNKSFYTLCRFTVH